MAVKTTTAPSDSTFFIEKSEFGEYNKMVSVEFTYNATFLNNKDLDKGSFNLSVELEKPVYGAIKGMAKGDIHNFDFKGYTIYFFNFIKSTNKFKRWFYKQT